MEAVIFDMDGVIIDTEDFWPEHEREIYRDAIAGEVDIDEVVSRIKGIFYRDIYNILAGEYDLEMDKDEFVSRYDEVAEEIYKEQASMMQEFDDIVDLIREKGMKIGMVTSSPWNWIDMAFDRFGFDAAFDLVVSGEDMEGKGKPAPDIYLRAADKLGVDPENCVAIEDSRNGATSASRAGMHVIGYSPIEGQDLSVADEIVEGPDELEQRLEELLKTPGSN